VPSSWDEASRPVGKYSGSTLKAPSTAVRPPPGSTRSAVAAVANADGTKTAAIVPMAVEDEGAVAVGPAAALHSWGFAVLW
jgi:hypothetical protein